MLNVICQVFLVAFDSWQQRYRGGWNPINHHTLHLAIELSSNNLGFSRYRGQTWLAPFTMDFPFHNGAMNLLFPSPVLWVNLIPLDWLVPWLVGGVDGGDHQVQKRTTSEQCQGAMQLSWWSTTCIQLVGATAEIVGRFLGLRMVNSID